MKIHPVGAKSIHTDGRTVRQTGRQTNMTNLVIAIRKFANAPKEGFWHFLNFQKPKTVPCFNRVSRSGTSRNYDHSTVYIYSPIDTLHAPTESGRLTSWSTANKPVLSLSTAPKFVFISSKVLRPQFFSKALILSFRKFPRISSVFFFTFR